jgi:L-threonylcarbamoyladenylate synthase
MNQNITQAVKLLKSGKLVTFPTETVYALAGCARSDAAIEQIYHLKGRNFNKPLALFFKDLAVAETYVEINAAAHKIAAAFCPGPITLVLKMKPGGGLSPRLNSGLQTLAIRIPDHPVAQAILQEYPTPIAATSTNRSGEPEAVTASEVAAYFGDAVECIKGEGCGGVVSTIVDLTGSAPRLLRAGAVPWEAVEAVLKGK